MHRALVLLVLPLVLMACSGSDEPAPTTALADTLSADIAPETDAASTEPIYCVLADITCEATEFCAFVAGAECGLVSREATCEPRPETCPAEVSPVCGCDGQNYGNPCEANAAGTAVRHEGTCGVGCTALRMDRCADDEYCAFVPSMGCGITGGGSTCRPRPQDCPDDEDPVCACGGETFGNSCKANAAGHGIKDWGPCD